MKTTLFLAAAAVTMLFSSCASTGGSGSTAAVKPYTSKMCVTTDNELGSMGKPITKVYNGQEVKFCCKPCIAKFEKNPQKYLASL